MKDFGLIYRVGLIFILVLSCGCWGIRYTYDFSRGGLVEIHSPGRVYLDVWRQTEMGLTGIPEKVLKERGVETLLVEVFHGMPGGISHTIVTIDSIRFRLDTSLVWKHLKWHARPNGNYGGSNFAVIDDIEIPYRYPGEISLRFTVYLRNPEDSSIIDHIPIDLGMKLKRKLIDTST